MSAECYDESEPFKFVPPRGPAAESCDPPAPIPPEKFYVPSSDPAPRQPPRTPAAVIIYSPNVVLACSDIAGGPPIGTPILVSSGQFQDTFLFSHIPGITASQLSYISTLPGEEVRRILDTGIEANEIASIFRLKLTQADFALNDVRSKSAALAEQARLQGVVALDCNWLSAAVTAACPAGAVTTGEGVPAYSVAAGAVRSKLSQTDADTQAVALAASNLNCVYGNAEVIVTCRDAGFPDDVPNDPEEGYPFTERRVGSVKVEAGAFLAASQEDADAGARLLALSQLNCVYYNKDLNISCADLDAAAYAGVLITPVSHSDGLRGNPVNVRAGVYTSLQSQEDADAQARAEGSLYLQCGWGNKEITLSCPDVELEVAGIKQTIKASASRSAAIAVTIAANIFVSTVSQEDADMQASLAAKATLSCTYCNARIPAKCVPSNIPQDVLPIPLAFVTSAWSEDATLGLEADVVCGDDAEQVLITAQAIENIPVKPKVGCVYTNDEITASCTIDEDAGVIGIFPKGTEGLSINSRPAPGESVTVAAGLVAVVDAEVPDTFMPDEPILAVRAKAYANAFARRFALSLLDCYFDNDEQVVTCDSIGKANVAPESTSTVKIAAGSYTSRISKEEANNLARTTALVQLDCFYLSSPMKVYCFQGVNSGTGVLPTLTGSDGAWSVYGDGTADKRGGDDGDTFERSVSLHSTGCYHSNFVPADEKADAALLDKPAISERGLFRSYTSQAECDTQALTAAVTTLDCYWDSPAMRIYCGDTVEAVLDLVRLNEKFPARVPPPKASEVDANATGAVAKPVEVVAELCTSYDGYLAATKQALLSSFSALNCYFSNDEVTESCDAGIFTKSAVVAVTIEAGKGPTSYDSKAAANQLASLIAKSQLACVYASEERRPSYDDPCTGGLKLPPVTIAAGSFTASTQEEANALAQLQADQMPQCAGTGDGPGSLGNALNDAPPGAPGGDGAQTNCAGECFGYYS